MKECVSVYCVLQKSVFQCGLCCERVFQCAVCCEIMNLSVMSAAKDCVSLCSVL